MSDDRKDRVLTAARAVFLRYGYRRVTMNDLAAAAGVSRPALYVLFRNKEEIFIGVFLQWVEETVAEVEAAMATTATAEEKLELAFEAWAVRPFEMTLASLEAHELVECGFGFAQASLRQGYATFEATIAPVLAALADRLPDDARASPRRTAHVLASAVRGLKETAATPGELRQLIRELLQLSFGRR